METYHIGVTGEPGTPGETGPRGPYGGDRREKLRITLQELGKAVARPAYEETYERMLKEGIYLQPNPMEAPGYVHKDKDGNIYVPVDWEVIRQAHELLRKYAAILSITDPEPISAQSGDHGII